jgi:signal transduction histidine kinase
LKKNRVERVLQKLKIAYFTLDEDFRLLAWSSSLKFYFTKPLKAKMPLMELIPVAKTWQEVLSSLKFDTPSKFNPIVQIGDSYYQFNFSKDEKESSEILVILADVTEREQQKLAAQQQIADLKSQIEALSQIKSAFLATAPHELRSPLSSVQSFLELVLESGASTLTEEQTYYLTIALNGVKRMLTLINDLLDIEQFESGNVSIEPFVFNLPNLVRNIVENYQAEMQRDSLTISFQNNSDLPFSELLVEADMGRIEQVLTNLITNAIKYNRPEKTIEISYELDRGNLITNIKDEGIGISEEDQAKLFQRFYRAGNVGQSGARGNGLGLSIAHAIIERHCGKIWFNSNLNEGSTFSFSLPLFIENLQSDE